MKTIFKFSYFAYVLFIPFFAMAQNSWDIDYTFNTGTGANNSVAGIVRQNDGKYVLAGDFSKFNGNSDSQHFVRLNYNGSTDSNFSGIAAIADKSYYEIAIQNDQKIFLATYGFFKRLNTDFTVDTSFSLGQFTSVPTARKIVTLGNGQLLVGIETNSYFTKGILRLNSDGSTDATWNGGTSANDTVSQIVVQPDGKILIAGYFTKYNGTDRYRFARLNADGSLDLTFKVSLPNGKNISSIAVQPDGKILIGGNFKSYYGTDIDSIARLNSDGSIDTTFSSVNLASSTGSVNSIILGADGKIYIGGLFPSNQNFCRLNADGTRDTTFTSQGTTGVVNSLLKDPDGKIVIVGNFSRYGGANGADKYGAVRIYADSVLGVSETNKKIFHVYPNPAKDFLNLDNLSKNATVKITDATGKLIYTSVSKDSNLKINTSNFANGIYFIEVNDNGKTTAQKFIVRK